ncbi:MAG: alanine dehydrogenase [Fidelibacterota bacterium]
MIIGVPKEIKANEYRVALIPGGVENLKQIGHSILIEKNAGIGSGFSDEDYSGAGAEICETAEEIYSNAELIVKVKEPQPEEFKYIRAGQIIFTFFHFAANRKLTINFIDSKAIGIAYETVQLDDGSLPLLIPMSEVAGRMAVQEGAKYLEKRWGGRGILLGGVPGVEPASVTILGGGVVGINAAKISAGMGAKVHVLDIDLERLRYLDDVMPENVFTLMSNRENIIKLLPETDLLIGAVLIPGAKAPKLVSRNMLKLMRPGSVIVDVAVDQGGCIETCKPTTHEKPIYIIDNVVHYCVANMPGAVPYTSTKALTNATFPYVLEIASNGFEKAIRKRSDLRKGLNIIEGKVTCKGVSDAFKLKYFPVEELLSRPLLL